MIAVQKIGNSFMGALGYNWKKLIHPDHSRRAELLATNFTSLELEFIKKEIELVRSLRPNLNRYVYHASINFPKDENLDNQKLVAIARDYMRMSGYTCNQYFVFRHHDSGHPHLHLLINRIGFDGSVVSDSNNYKRSEVILRQLERQYGLERVYTSNHLSSSQDSAHITKEGTTKHHRQNRPPLRAPAKDEIEMAVRTSRPSVKMLLQEKLSDILALSNQMRLPEFISRCEAAGINLLFNQATTGRVSGITYFHDGFKMKGQALGNRFKWAEIIKNLDYEQDRDGKAISEAGERTRAIYGGNTKLDYSQGRMGAANEDIGNYAAKFFEQRKASPAGTGKVAQESAADHRDDDSNNSHATDHTVTVGYVNNIEISDDIDDEAILGRNRRRQQKARTNQR